MYCFAVSLCIEMEEYGKSYFFCEPDAQKETEKFSKNFRHCMLVNSGIVKEEIPRQGRKPKLPVPVEEKLYRYKIELEIGINQEYCVMVWLINLVCPKIYIKFNLICLNINFDLISFVRV